MIGTIVFIVVLVIVTAATPLGSLSVVDKSIAAWHHTFLVSLLQVESCCGAASTGQDPPAWAVQTHPCDTLRDCWQH